MIERIMGVVEFFALVSALSLAAGRLLKRFAPGLDPRALPWIVIGLAGGLVLGDQLAAGASLRVAIAHAASGLLSGAVAVGAHEASKGVLVPLVGESAAEAIIGKLRGQ